MTGGTSRHFTWAGAAGCLAICAVTGVARAQPVQAGDAEIAYFVGRWATGPAERAGMETIVARGATCDAPVEVAPSGPGRIVRSVQRRDGGRTSVAFSVKRFGGNFPWWPEQPGPGIVARRLDDGGFLLAGLVAGRADWDNAIRHRRCP